jgi:hypothetical protein
MKLLDNAMSLKRKKLLIKGTKLSTLNDYDMVITTWHTTSGVAQNDNNITSSNDVTLSNFIEKQNKPQKNMKIQPKF